MDDLSLSSLLLHADDSYHSDAAVSAPISLSTTFRFPEKPDEVPVRLFLSHSCHAHPLAKREGDDPAVFNPFKPDFHIYSRYSQPTLVRAEALVSAACVSDLLSNSRLLLIYSYRKVLRYSIQADCQLSWLL